MSRFECIRALRVRTAGINLIEMSISVALSTLIVGSIIMVQSTATDGFVVSVGEQRVTTGMREGVGDVKQELRSAVASSISIHPSVDAESGSTAGGSTGGSGSTGGLGGIVGGVLNEGGTTGGTTGSTQYIVGQIGNGILDRTTDGVPEDTTLFSFQQAVSFDAQTGATTWGGGNIADAKIEYYLAGRELRRRVRLADDTLVPNQDTILVANLDRSGANGPPIEFEYTQSSGYLSLTVRTLVMVGEQPVRRTIATVIHLESIYRY